MNGRSSRKKKVVVRTPWIPVPLDFLRARACAELSPLSAKLLFDVLSMLGPNANGNGDVSLAPKIMEIRGWSSRASLNAAVKELEAHGLLIKTRQGSRLDTSLYACTLYPLDCDQKKIDVKPGAYRQTDYMGENARLAAPPSEADPARWRRPRKSKSLAPSRNETPEKRSAAAEKRSLAVAA